MAPDASPIKSVDRALVLLDLLRGQGSVSVAEAAEHLAVAPSTAHRPLNALAVRGGRRPPSEVEDGRRGMGQG